MNNWPRTEARDEREADEPAEAAESKCTQLASRPSLKFSAIICFKFPYVKNCIDLGKRTESGREHDAGEREALKEDGNKPSWDHTNHRGSDSLPESWHSFRPSDVSGERAR